MENVCIGGWVGMSVAAGTSCCWPWTWTWWGNHGQRAAAWSARGAAGPGWGRCSSDKQITDFDEIYVFTQLFKNLSAVLLAACWLIHFQLLKADFR